MCSVGVKESLLILEQVVFLAPMRTVLLLRNVIVVEKSIHQRAVVFLAVTRNIVPGHIAIAEDLSLVRMLVVSMVLMRQNLH